MLSANILSSVVNNKLDHLSDYLIVRIYLPDRCPGDFFLHLNINSIQQKSTFPHTPICLKAVLPATWHFYLFLK